jgi:hypothetical protein
LLTVGNAHSEALTEAARPDSMAALARPGGAGDQKKGSQVALVVHSVTRALGWAFEAFHYY